MLVLPPAGRPFLFGAGVGCGVRAAGGVEAGTGFALVTPAFTWVAGDGSGGVLVLALRPATPYGDR